MGIIIELAKARRKIRDLEEENIKLLAKMIPPLAPFIRGIIPAVEVRRLYLDIFPGKADKIFISDNQYEITAISEMRRFVDWDVTDQGKYIAEIKDCDDFALVLAGSFAKYPGWSGFPQSFIWGDYLGGHAFATCVAWESFEVRVPRVYFQEPQNDHELAFEMIGEMELQLLPI